MEPCSVGYATNRNGEEKNRNRPERTGIGTERRGAG